jgi:hypothetical protein
MTGAGRVASNAVTASRANVLFIMTDEELYLVIPGTHESLEANDADGVLDPAADKADTGSRA